ncbi:MAG: glycosyltransferase [Rubrivivax sp.]
MAAPPVSASKFQAPALVLLSHGYEAIYERGFCNGVADAGLSFTLVSSDRTDVAGLRPAVQTLNLRGSQAEGRSKASKLLNLLRYHLQVMGLVLRRRPVVHMFGLLHPALLCGVFEGLLWRLFARRYVLTAHDLLPHDRHTAWNRRVFGLSYRLAHRVVVHTPRMRDELVSMHRVDPARVVVMEHGVEPLAGPLPAREPADGCLRLLFFGKVMRYKGVDLLLQALEQMPLPFRLVIAGGCWEPALEQELHARIAAHPHAGAIEWRSHYIPEGDIPGLFGAADALVLPYRHIDQSGILFQSLRYGVPVVASRVGSFEQYVTAGVGETFAGGDADALREALLRLHARLAELGPAQVRAAGQRYEWPQTARVLVPVYTLADGGRP